MDSFLLIRGIAGIVVGILAVAWPGMTIAVLVAIFGVYAIIDRLGQPRYFGSRPRRTGHSAPVDEESGDRRARERSDAIRPCSTPRTTLRNTLAAQGDR